MQSATMKGFSFYRLISNITFTNILSLKEIRKLQIFENTKLALIPLLPTLCVCENVD